MTSSIIILDHIDSITIDKANPPIDNYQAIESSRHGLKMLAEHVRSLELKYIENDPYAEHVVFHSLTNFSPSLPCEFNWFALTLVNYLRIISLIDLMNKNSWKSTDLAIKANEKIISGHCTKYVQTVAPDVYLWRNKVAAHFAATDPRSDNLATIEQSLMSIVDYKYPHFQVALGTWNTNGIASTLPNWSLTKVYEDIGSRFWPNDKLQPFPPRPSQQA